ncbi:hypothetical protein [Xanthomonas phage NED111]|uniref:Uncharacterized protein n=1 Tax=Xanthomonas phage NED111 TaxID=2982921 RepID=A0AAX3EYK4_9CAUD|nr:hypothetical protein [Xanthomonas phage NED111]
MFDVPRSNVRVAPGYKKRKRGFKINRAFTKGNFCVQWYDGKATYWERYVPWYEVPLAMFQIWRDHA